MRALRGMIAQRQRRDEREEEVEQDQEGRPDLDAADDGELDDERELADVEEERTAVVDGDGDTGDGPDLVEEDAHTGMVGGQEAGRHTSPLLLPKAAKPERSTR
ncbi:hypothetical protein [Microbispora rosea]|uniref:hypothetical protein n=2 Tax=Microbispora rosea TaxID=58117 RepID=UPI001950B957|nr:hypothetical protein [Microbispora rosea]